MPTRIKMQRHRLVLCRLGIELIKRASQGYGGNDQFGANAGDVLILFGVFIGHAENRPMTAAKLAIYVGIPRSTVARRLRHLQAAGLVVIHGDGTTSCNAELLNAPHVMADVDAAIAAVRRAAAELSKMDTNPVARSHHPSVSTNEDESE